MSGAYVQSPVLSGSLKIAAAFHSFLGDLRALKIFQDATLASAFATF